MSTPTTILIADDDLDIRTILRSHLESSGFQVLEAAEVHHARVEQGDKVLTVFADDDFKLEQVIDVLKTKLSKRNVDIRCLDYAKVEKVSGNKVKQAITVKVGVDTELAKKLAQARTRLQKKARA